MKRSMPKSKVISELAEATNVNKKSVADVLDNLALLAYREARNGFIVPGICKLKVVKRKASKCRNPSTGSLMMIGEHDVLKMVPVKKAKDRVAPRPEGLVRHIPEQEQNVSSASSSPPAKAVKKPPRTVSEPDAEINAGSGQVLFECTECGSMVAAPVEEAGKQGECPFCGVEISIPSQEDIRRLGEVEKLEADKAPAHTIEDFITFVCQTCGQEIEAPVDMIGMEVNCPTCASELHIPSESMAPGKGLAEAEKENQEGKPNVDRASMTMRIDLSDMV
ncbi:MAG: HU family DNA-binding protein [Verrucomicrobiota bacterium]